MYDIFFQTIFNNFFFLYKHFFFVLKSSETYGKKILPSALFEGGGSERKILARFLAPVQEDSIAAEGLFQLSEFCSCLTDLLCITTASLPTFLTQG